MPSVQETAALGYAQRGWKVFPVKRLAKEPLTKNGFKEATDDPEQIALWWLRWDDANIGLACEASGLVVADFDGLDVLDAFSGDLPLTTCSETARGAHLFYRVPEGRTARRNGASVDGIERLDVRSNGYVILPPSVHPSGKSYRWVHGPDQIEPQPAPEWLLADAGTVRIRPPAQTQRPAPVTRQPSDEDTSYGLAALQLELDDLRATGEGGRNDRLNEAAFSLSQLVAGGELRMETMLSELRSAGEQIGLTESEIAKTIASGMTAGQERPRTAPEVANVPNLRLISRPGPMRHQRMSGVK